MRTRGAPPTCHPDRPLLAKGRCEPCYQREYKAALRKSARSTRPYLVPSHRAETLPALSHALFARSHIFTTWPDACPKCRRSTTLARDGRELHCVGARTGCGWTGALVAEEVYA
jgi:hypothetical protein